MEKYLSIITNFGCHYTCPYCIVKNNDIKVPKTTVEGLKNLENCCNKNDIDVVSISGGGDPLYQWRKHTDWWSEMLRLVDTNRKVEIHTSYIDYDFVNKYLISGDRIVYHLNSVEQLSKIKRVRKEIIRIVFVITDDMIERDLYTISEFVKNSSSIDELSFRQRVDKDYQLSYHLHDVLTKRHKKDWYYITQGDYNLYYVEGKTYTQYKDLQTQEV